VVDLITRDFLRNGFACVENTLSPEQLAYGQEGANRVMVDQAARNPLEEGKRGFARYSFGTQIEHPV
jgi:hypothetical protein